MIRSLKDLKDYPITAAEGEVGRVRDFYFDDYNWRLRYIIAELAVDGKNQQVLLSPFSFQPPDGGEQRLALNISVDVIRNSPAIPVDLPLSRQQEVELHDYYELPYYWGSPTVSGQGPGNLLASYPLIELEQEIENKVEEQADAAGEVVEPEFAEPIGLPATGQPTTGDDSHLRSVREVTGYKIEARDGSIGDVDNFLVEDENWNLLYIIVDTGGWLPGKKVLLSPQWVEKVDWREKHMQVDLARETIKNSPEYDPDLPLERRYEGQLYDYYGRVKYWDK